MTVPERRAQHPDDGLDAYIAEQEAVQPGFATSIEEGGWVVDVTTELWQRREAIGMSLDEVARRSRLTELELDQVEDNAIDVPLELVVRYAKAIGMTIRASLD